MSTTNAIPVGSEKVRQDLAAAGIKPGPATPTSATPSGTKQDKMEAKRQALAERTRKREEAAREKERKREEREEKRREKQRVAQLETLQKKLGKLDKQLAKAVEDAIKAATHPDLKPMVSMVMGKPVQMPRLGDKHYECLEFVRPLLEKGRDTNDIITDVQKHFDFSRGLAKNYTIMAIERIECGVPPKADMEKAADKAKKEVEAEFAKTRKELEQEIAKLQKAA